MPQHVYLPTRQPPKWYDRVLVHPMDHAAALIAAVYGVCLSILFPATGQLPSDSFADLPEWIVFGSGLFLMLGGVLVILGHHWSDEMVSRGWGIEQGGWTFAGGGFVALALSFGFTGNFTGIVLAGALGLGSCLRWLSLVLMRGGARALIEKAEEVDRRPEG